INRDIPALDDEFLRVLPEYLFAVEQVVLFVFLSELNKTVVVLGDYWDRHTYQSNYEFLLVKSPNACLEVRVSGVCGRADYKCVFVHLFLAQQCLDPRSNEVFWGLPHTSRLTLKWTKALVSYVNNSHCD